MTYKQINVKIRNDLVLNIKTQANDNLRTMQAELEKILIEYFQNKADEKTFNESNPMEKTQ